MTDTPAAAPTLSTDAATSPLVLHVVPTPTARGAQREARALADQLDLPGIRRHRLLTLFEGTGDPSEVATDYSLGRPRGHRPAEGFDPRVVRKLRHFLSRTGPRVVVTHGSDPLKYVTPAMVLRRRALVHYAIGTYSGTRGGLQLAAWRTLTGRADAVAACGEETLEECATLLRVSRAKLALVYNGRDPEVFRPRRANDGAPGRDPLVVFVGALTAGKRPDRFVDLISALRARGVRLRAQLIGDGPAREQVAADCAEAGVEMLGARDDVPALLRVADLLVFPSLPAGEGMPGVLIEAALSGVPVVATEVPGVRTIVEDGVTGSVVPLEDFDAMVAAAGALLVDPERRASMGKAARRRAEERFSTRAVGERWLRVLEPFLPEGSPPQ